MSLSFLRYLRFYDFNGVFCWWNSFLTIVDIKLKFSGKLAIEKRLKLCMTVLNIIYREKRKDSPGHES